MTERAKKKRKKERMSKALVKRCWGSTSSLRINSYTTQFLKKVYVWFKCFSDENTMSLKKTLIKLGSCDLQVEADIQLSLFFECSSKCIKTLLYYWDFVKHSFATFSTKRPESSGNLPPSVRMSTSEYNNPSESSESQTLRCTHHHCLHFFEWQKVCYHKAS